MARKKTERKVPYQDTWRIPDALWERIEPLLPPGKPHPLGCHNPPVPARAAMNAIFFVLRTGCHTIRQANPRITSDAGALVFREMDHPACVHNGSGPRPPGRPGHARPRRGGQARRLGPTGQARHRRTPGQSPHGLAADRALSLVASFCAGGSDHLLTPISASSCVHDTCTIRVSSRLPRHWGKGGRVPPQHDSPAPSRHQPPLTTTAAQV